MIAALAGCAFTATSSTTPTTPTTPGSTADTGEAPEPLPCPDGDYAICGFYPDATLVLTATAQGTECSTYAYDAVMTATPLGPGEVRFEHFGAVDGCGGMVDVPVYVGLDETASTGRYIWWTGDCDGIFCTDFEATVTGFPAGTWQLEERRAGTITFTVP